MRKSPPGPCQMAGRTAGAHYFFLLVARGPFGGCEGDWAHPRAAITHAPRGAFPLKNQTGATKFKNRQSGRPGRGLPSLFRHPPPVGSQLSAPDRKVYSTEIERKAVGCVHHLYAICTNGAADHGE